MSSNWTTAGRQRTESASQAFLKANLPQFGSGALALQLPLGEFWSRRGMFFGEPVGCFLAG